MLPDGPPYVRELRLSLAPSSVLPCPLLGFRVASAALSAVWGCLGRPALLLPAWVLYLGWWLGLRLAAAGALLPDGPHWSCGSWEVLGSLLVLPWPLVCFQVHLLCSSSCQQVVLGLHPSPSGEVSAST